MIDPVRATQRTAVAVNLEFTRGRHGAGARLELFEGPGAFTAVLALRGWIDAAAARRIELTIDDLLARGVRRLDVDASCLQHVDYRQVPRLTAALARFESSADALRVSGLSRYLRDLIRLSGFDAPWAEPGPGVGRWEPASLAAASDERAS